MKKLVILFISLIAVSSVYCQTPPPTFTYTLQDTPIDDELICLAMAGFIFAVYKLAIFKWLKIKPRTN